MVCWWVPVRCGWEFAIWRGDTCFVFGIFQCIVGSKLKLVHTFQLDSPVRKSSSARKQRIYEMSTYGQMSQPIINHEVARGWTLLYFIADYAFSVVASTPELFIFTIACLFCNSQHRWERCILLLSIG